MPTCAPLRRHSYSAPASLLLDGCLARAASLNDQLDRLSARVSGRSRSLEKLNTEVVPCSALDTLVKMVCHGCHGPVGGGAHVGSATGKNHCRFLHSSTCQGGIVEDESWRACPPAVQTDMLQSSLVSNGQTMEDDLLRFQRQANGEGVRERHPGMVYTGNTEPNSPLPVPMFSTQSQEDLPQSLPSDIEAEVVALRARNQQAQAAALMGDKKLTIDEVRKIPGMKEIVSDKMVGFQEKIPALSAALTPSIPSKESQHTVSDQVPGPDELEVAQSEYSELLAQQQQVSEALQAAQQTAEQQQQQVFVTQHLQQQSQVPEQQQSTQYQSPPGFQPGQNGNTPHNSLNLKNGSLDFQRELQLQQREQQRLQDALELQKQQYRALLVQQQQQASFLAAQKQKFEQEQAAAKLREQKERNARVAAELKTAQQELANLHLKQSIGSHLPQARQSYARPVAPAPVIRPSVCVATPSQPALVMNTPTVGDIQFTPEYDFYRRPDGSIYKVLRQSSIPPSTGYQPSSAPEVSQRLNSASGSAFYEWRMDQTTGVSYQVLVQPVHQKQQNRQSQQCPQEFQAQNGQSHSSQFEQHFPQSQSFPSPQFAQSMGQSGNQASGVSGSTVAQQLKEKVAGIVNLVESGGEPKKFKLLDHVRSCPAKWAKKVTLENMNLPVYGYGITAELTASLSGRAPAMSPEVLLAKIQHLQNTFTVCCLNTTEKEFSNYGWVLARDYAMKVQDRVSQNLASWETLSSEVQTSDLVASQMEFPRPVEKKEKEKKKEEERKQTPWNACKTWNTCTTDRKCQYEVDHPDKTCKLKHECSSCRSSLNQSHKHQAWKCPNKDK